MSLAQSPDSSRPVSASSPKHSQNQCELGVGWAAYVRWEDGSGGWIVAGMRTGCLLIVVVTQWKKDPCGCDPYAKAVMVARQGNRSVSVRVG
ncbi:hypothetical protein M8818_003407 [Zalaria obscura]|uniref:Uncharacterized protein n=1 Tax=Zalaria obscura TaxID=2024903 RepID=A0ACC3SFN0_9PEZI